MEVCTGRRTREDKIERKICSFVRRRGRLTRGQADAINGLWKGIGIDYHPRLPLHWKAVFGNDNPVTLEVGFGMGASLVEMARCTPEKNFIGIEVYLPGVGACLKAAKEARVDNLRIICHDAVEVLEHMLPDGSLSVLQLFFPDPWEKKRHNKRRLVQTSFLDVVRKKLVPERGLFLMATDCRGYAEYVLKIVSETQGYKNMAEDGHFVPRPNDLPLTKFEKRGIQLGFSILNIKLLRTNESLPLNPY